MDQIQVTVQHRADIPGGLPAVWTVERCPNNVGARVHLYLRKGLPTEVADKFRAMCVRDVLPDCSFDSFTVTSLAAQVRALQGVG